MNVLSARTPMSSGPKGRPALNSALTGAAGCAAYGALVGGATSALYTSTELMTATGIHAGGILAGGALGAVTLGPLFEKKMEKPAAYALGALAGAGVTWGTSAFGLLQNPGVAIVAGAALGTFYGAVGGAILGSEGTNDTKKSSEGGLSFKPLAVAYGLGGAAITGAMVAKGLAGTLTPGLAVAGTLVATGAFVNAYLTAKLS